MGLYYTVLNTCLEHASYKMIRDLHSEKWARGVKIILTKILCLSRQWKGIALNSLAQDTQETQSGLSKKTLACSQSREV